MTKVAHLTSVHKDLDVRIFWKECVSLANEGYEVYQIIPNTKTRIFHNVQILSFQHQPKRRIGRIIGTVNRVLKKALEIDADIYHLHDPELLRIALKLKRKGKIVIYDSHEDLPRQVLAKDWIPKGIRNIISKRVEKFENKRIKKIDGVIAATPFIKDRFIQVNTNTIDINNFPILDELIINQDYTDKKENNICYVGGITTVRGITELIEALEHVDAKLLLAGNFDSKSLRSELMQKRSWSKVEELGFLSREEVKNTYLKSKVGIVTLHPIINYLDAYPVKMFEYMAAGLPVIASNFPLWKEIVEVNKTGICVDPLDPKTISDAINRILKNPKEAAEMGRNGKALVLTKYNWEIERQKLITFYAQLLS